MKTIYVLASSAKRISELAILNDRLANFFNIYFIFTPNAGSIFKKEINKLPKNKVILNFCKQKLPKEDLILFYPCTYNSLNKVYLNIADNLPLSLFFASSVPKMIVPSMNIEYWNNLDKYRLAELSKKYTVTLPIIENNKISACNVNKVADNIYLFFYKYKNIKLISSANQKIDPTAFNEYKKIRQVLKKYITCTNSSGNIAFKLNNQLFVSSSGYNIFELDKNTVVPFDYNTSKNIIYYNPKYPTPSVESPFIYQLFNKYAVKYVIHFHDTEITYNDKYNMYKSATYHPYGCNYIFEDINKLILKYKFFIMKEHGVFIIVDTLKELDKIMNFILFIDRG